MRMGVDYYPEHWDPSRWSVDAALMREAGITVVRLAEFAWSRLEPAEGNYDFAWLDRAIDLLRQAGIDVILGTPTAAPPAWLCEKHPEIYPADARGYRLGFGTRVHRCANSPTMRSYSRKITQAMVEHFAANPAVIGWQTDNEFTANTCYCDVCAARFRDWLRSRYGSLEALNAAWGTAFWSQEYSSWSQIPLPWQVRCGQYHNPSLQLEYMRFASMSTIDFHREQAEIIRRLAPKHFVTHNMMGTYDSSLDLFELGEHIDHVSFDLYPGGHLGGYPRIDLAHDAMRGIKQKNYWMTEQQCGVAGWDTMKRRPLDAQIRQWAWQAIAHGADAVMFFRWRSCRSGTEQFWHGILNHDAVPRRRYLAISKLGNEFRDLSATVDGTEVRNRVAIINSYEQNWAFQIQPQAEGLGWWEQVRRYHDSLRRLGVGVDLPPLSVDLSRYAVVILPGWYLMDPADIDKLRAYVQDGGTLVVSPRTGVKDAVNLCREEPLPGLLSEVVGVEIDDYDPLGKAENTVRLSSGTECCVSAWADALVLKDAQALATYTESVFAGEPAVARNLYGQGIAYYFGTYGDTAFYDELLGQILDEAAVDRFRKLPDGVDVSWRVGNGKRVLFLINTVSEERTLTIPSEMTTELGPAPDNGHVNLPGFCVAIYSAVDSANAQG